MPDFRTCKSVMALAAAARKDVPPHPTWAMLFVGCRFRLTRSSGIKRHRFVARGWRAGGLAGRRVEGVENAEESLQILALIGCQLRGSHQKSRTLYLETARNNAPSSGRLPTTSLRTNPG